MPIDLPIMSGNRSLDEFAGAGGDPEADADADVDGDGPEREQGGTGEEVSNGTGDPNLAGRDDDGAGVPDETAIAPGTSGDRTSDTVHASASTPAPVLRWSSEPAACDRCGERIRRRWADGEAYVCAACKDW